MADSLAEKVREFISERQGKEIDIGYIRKELKINPDSSAWENLHVILHRLVAEHKIKHTGKKDGVYKIISQVEPLQVFGVERERRPLLDLIFPKDDKGNELDFAKYVSVREGDLIIIGGIKSSGKTTLSLNFCAENIEKHPVLMGNEYTVLVGDEKDPNNPPHFEPAPRFLSRLDTMSEWIPWQDNVTGMDKFTLLPVREDYAEHIIKDRINIIDWINVDTEKLYSVTNVLEDIKKNLGRGVGIAVLQKGEMANNPRGGQFARDFADLEILIDKYGENPYDVLLTIKGVKEATEPIAGKSYVYTIRENGCKITNFREVRRCGACFQGKSRGQTCNVCGGTSFVDVIKSNEGFLE